MGGGVTEVSKEGLEIQGQHTHNHPAGNDNEKTTNDIKTVRTVYEGKIALVELTNSKLGYQLAEEVKILYGIRCAADKIRLFRFDHGFPLSTDAKEPLTKFSIKELDYEGPVLVQLGDIPEDTHRVHILIRTANLLKRVRDAILSDFNDAIIKRQKLHESNVESETRAAASQVKYDQIGKLYEPLMSSYKQERHLIDDSSLGSLMDHLFILDHAFGDPTMRNEATRRNFIAVLLAHVFKVVAPDRVGLELRQEETLEHQSVQAYARADFIAYDGNIVLAIVEAKKSFSLNALAQAICMGEIALSLNGDHLSEFDQEGKQNENSEGPHVIMVVTDWSTWRWLRFSSGKLEQELDVIDWSSREKARASTKVVFEKMAHILRFA